MAELVATFPVGAFTDPQNGNAPVDADEVRANDDALRTGFNSHDADGTIHFQGSVLASRPGAGTLGRKWFASDTKQVFRDNGSSWDEIDYLHKTNGGTVAGATTFSGGLTSTAGSRTLGATTFTGTVSGVAASFSSTITAAGGTLTGALSGTSASFSGTVSTGALTAASLSVTGQASLNAATNTIGSGTGSQRLDLVAAAASVFDIGATGSGAQLRFGRFSTGSGGYVWEDTSVSANDAMTLNLAGDLTLALKASMTGGITIAAGGLTIGTTAGAGAAGRIVKHTTDGFQISGLTGSAYDFVVATPAGGYVMRVPTGTANVQFVGTVTATGQINGSTAVFSSTIGAIGAISSSASLDVNSKFVLKTKASTVSTSDVIINNGANTEGAYAIVRGDDSAGKRFTDLVFYGEASFQVLASLTNAGVPAARTYTAGGGALQLRVAAGTYSVACSDARGVGYA